MAVALLGLYLISLDYDLYINTKCKMHDLEMFKPFKDKAAKFHVCESGNKNYVLMKSIYIITTDQ